MPGEGRIKGINSRITFCNFPFSFPPLSVSFLFLTVAEFFGFFVFNASELSEDNKQKGHFTSITSGCT